MIEGRKNSIKRLLLVFTMYGLIYLVYLIIKPEPECDYEILLYNGEEIKCQSYKYENKCVEYTTCDGDTKKINVLSVLLIKKYEQTR